MQWAMAGTMFILWALGFVVLHLGALIHLLIVVAVVMIVGTMTRGVGCRRAI